MSNQHKPGPAKRGKCKRRPAFNLESTLRNINAWDRVTARQRVEDEESLQALKEAFQLL